MEPLRQIMHGVTDFALMRRENAYFVDRTALIRELEKTRYAMFLRPRRFGKSLFCSILQAYYDSDYAERFDELFGGLDIGRDPTSERGRYLFLNFNFTGVEKVFERVQSSFNDYCCLRLDKFARDHASPIQQSNEPTIQPSDNPPRSRSTASSSSSTAATWRSARKCRTYEERNVSVIWCCERARFIRR